MILQKPKLVLYIDDSNLYYRGKASGWMVDYKKLYQWVAGDSDFVRTKETTLKAGKKIKFLAYENNCAWEIRSSWHIFLDEIRDEIERRIP